MVYHAYLLPVLQHYDPVIQSTINDWQSLNWLSEQVDRAYSFLADRYSSLKGLSSDSSENPSTSQPPNSRIPLSTLFYEYAKDTMFSTIPAYWAATTDFQSTGDPGAARRLAHLENSYTSLLLDQFKENPSNEPGSGSGFSNNGNSVPGYAYSASDVSTSWGYSILSSLTFLTIPKLADTINGTFMNNNPNSNGSSSDAENGAQTQESHTSLFSAVATGTDLPGSSTELLEVAKHVNDPFNASTKTASTVNNNRKFSWTSIFRKQQPQYSHQRNASSPLPATNHEHQKKNDDSECCFVFTDDNVKLSYNDGINEKDGNNFPNRGSGYSNFGWVNVTKEKVA